VDFFGPRTVLLMYFRNFPHPLRVTISGSDELYIGRATANAAMAPEIDLVPVNAGSFGVSRLHAVVTRRDDKLLIADLESMNFTYINGVRLLPHKTAVLKDGDEVWFGQLECRIRFQHS
jgi:pSer/pThr/pTyr-binding forkhead associated (FHA) protein